jgi:hypothetical protein
MAVQTSTPLPRWLNVVCFCAPLPFLAFALWYREPSSYVPNITLAAPPYHLPPGCPDISPVVEVPMPRACASADYELNTRQFGLPNRAKNETWYRYGSHALKLYCLPFGPCTVEAIVPNRFRTEPGRQTTQSYRE